METAVLPRARIKKLVHKHADLRQSQDSYAILQHVYLTIAYTTYRRCRNALRQRTGNADGRIQVQDVDTAALHFSYILPAVQQPDVTPKRCDFAGAPPYPSCVYVPSATFQRLIHTMRVHLQHGTSKSKGAMNLMHLFTERLFVKFISHMVRTFLHYANRKVIHRRDVVYSLTAFEAFRKLHDLPRRLPSCWFQGEIDEDYEPSSSSSGDGTTSSSESSSDDEGGGANVMPVLPPESSSSSEEEGAQDGGNDHSPPPSTPPLVGPTHSNSTAEEEKQEEPDLGGGYDYSPPEEQAEEQKEEEQDFGGGNDYSPPPHTPPPPLPPPPTTPPQPRPAAQRRQRTPRRLDLAPVLLHPRTRRPPTHLADYEQHLDMRTVSRILPANRRVVRIEHTQDNALRAFIAAYNHTPPAPRPRLTMRAVRDLLLINPVTTGGNRDRRDFATLARELNIRLIIVDANGEESIAYGQSGGKTVFIERTQHYDPIYLIDTPERRAGRTAPPAYVPRSASDLRQHADRNNGETQTLATLRRLRTAPPDASAMRRLQQVVRRTPVSSGHDTSPALPRVFPPRQRVHTRNSWLYMAVILGALQTHTAPDTASAVVNAAVRIYRGVFRANRVTLAMVRDLLDDDRHMSAELQEALLTLSPPHANALALYALSTFRSSDETRR
ncbi:hypothetical protein JKP88DRAFT_243948 [Tribonema minus]|uniref:Uncharacterized protein n=1 Tax=Tribonema minus TaxID=303371 RepID=A0A835Z6P3_9STRA|nr:hypothetical protein JKP88DRAFT_243948 [Tribonema minus]